MTPRQLDASNLVGEKLGRWKIIHKREKTIEDNSGAFSSCYEVEDDDGNIGFLKAFNIRYALQAVGNTMDRLHEMTERFTYERDLHSFCRERGMNRVVAAIDHGEYAKSSGDVPVPYLVFEVAKGNLKNVNILEDPDIAWKLSAFHGALVGTSQLHQERIAHQDIKPSNILIFGSMHSKICDLGSATKSDLGFRWNQPEDMLTDLRYAPIELLYHYYSSDWDTRRFGADLFMLGGLLSYMVSGITVLSGILSKLPQEQHWRLNQTSFKEALPNIMMAYHETIREIEVEIPEPIRNSIVEVIYQLSYPLPEERGNPPKIIGKVAKYSLRRYISIVDRIAKEYRVLMR